jgi:hypothetical protein
MKKAQGSCMNRILIAFSGMLLPAFAMADFYTYPSRIDFDPACTLPAEELEAVAVRYTDPEGGPTGVARASAVDLTQDGQCEIFLDMPAMYEGNGNSHTTVLIKRNGEFVEAGGISWTPESWWYGEVRNGYVRIFVPTYTGHRTNPEHVTAVYAFDGEKYVEESAVTATHGFYLDQGLKAYRAGNFELAERYYQNAYRMRAEPGLSDANNLALVWLKLGKTAAAKALLGMHLATDAPPVQTAAEYFNLGLIEERLGNRDAALRHYRHADEIESTPARREKLRELTSPAALSR